jgi:ABC-type molybdate transport system substrate-binding protein
MKRQNLKRTLSAVLIVAVVLIPFYALYATQIWPPWISQPAGGKHFTVPQYDNVPDLHGEIENPQLVVFFAGNQFMVIADLVKAFREQYPEYKRIYLETLPPGILEDQIDQGGLVMGNLKITVQPDIFTGGKGRVASLQKEKNWFANTVDYARNRLAIMVYKGNPKNIKSLADFARDDVKVSMPNPQWEGIGKHIVQAYKNVGGEKLVNTIMKTKVDNGSTFLTHIHHRQTPVRIMLKESDAGAVWYTEANFQQMINNPIQMIEIPDKDNEQVTYTAGSMKSAPHPEAAKRFLDFLMSDKGQAVYKKYGFMPPK